jgi:hypothetical protein
MMFPFQGRTNVDPAGELVRLGPNHRDDQHAVPEHGINHLNAVSQQEAPLKLPRGDAAMQELAVRVVLLPSTHDELIVLLGDFELVQGKARNGDRNQETLCAVVVDGPFDVVGRVTVRGPAEPVDAFLIDIEPQQERRRKQRDAGHPIRPSTSNVARRPKVLQHRRTAQIWGTPGAPSRSRKGGENHG